LLLHLVERVRDPLGRAARGLVVVDDRVALGVAPADAAAIPLVRDPRSLLRQPGERLVDRGVKFFLQPVVIVVLCHAYQ